MEYTITLDNNPPPDRKRVCCNCGNNKRIADESGGISNKCAIDGHYIGYVEYFEGWCNRWRKEAKHAR